MKVVTAGRRGKMAKTVTVYSNDPVQPRLVLTVQGIVELLAGLDPSYLSLHDVAAGSVVKRTVKIVGKQAAVLQARAIRVDRPELAARLTREAGAPAIGSRPGIPSGPPCSARSG